MSDVVDAAMRFVDELKRLEVLVQLQLLDTSPNERWDRPTRLLRTAARAPIALISLVDRDRQWFLSRCGLAICETPRGQSFCAQAILGPTKQMIVEDATMDDRFKANLLVTGEPHIRAYAGHVLEVDGQPLGTVCLIDTVPRKFSREDLASLEDAAGIVRREIMLNRLVVR